jgi:hypothetical protein
MVADQGDDLTNGLAESNFVILDGSLPEVGSLVAAMLKARDAVENRSWLPPQESMLEVDPRFLPIANHTVPSFRDAEPR